MTLKTVLSDLIHTAQAKVNVPIHTQLKDGLHISITQTSSGDLFLKIYRDNAPPSITEWNTVIRNFPWHIFSIPLPTGQTQHGWYTLSANIPPPNQNQLDLFA